MAGYEKEIRELKQILIHRAMNAGVYDKQSTQVFHVEENGFIYIIVNPLVTDYDPGMKPFVRRNVSTWCRDGFVDESGRYCVERGLYPILMPWLLARINIETGEIKDGHTGDLILGRELRLETAVWWFTISKDV